MSTALRKREHTTFMVFDVAVGDVTYDGRAVVFTDAYTVEDAGGATDLAIGIARETLAISTAIQRCEVTLFAPVEPVDVGTGGATRGTKAVLVSDGFTDAATHDSDGTGNESNYGIFMQSGTAGQKVGLMLHVGNRGK